VKVGIDATPLLGTRTGVGTYVSGLLSGLAALDEPPEVVLTAFTWRGVEALPSGYARAPRRFSARALQALWSRFDRPAVESLSGPVDVFHGTNFVLPPTRRAAGVVTIHDLSYEMGTVAPASQRYRTLVPRALRRGAVVVTPSETVAGEVRERYGLPGDRVVAARLGVGPEWFAPARPPRGLPDEYVLFVGSREPRKSLPVLLDAMARLRVDDPATPPLVLVGPPGWGPEVEAGPFVRTAGYLSGPDLVSAVAHARAFAFPSSYEGFGLPPLEALATGTPVVASDLPVLREVLGEHASYAPVGDADALAAAIAATLRAGDGGTAAREVRAAHAATFTWQRCARETVAAYERALRSGP
jgi:glycosyltransferase involved in cell wall biosynthesis